MSLYQRHWLPRPRLQLSNLIEVHESESESMGEVISESMGEVMSAEEEAANR